MYTPCSSFWIRRFFPGFIRYNQMLSAVASGAPVYLKATKPKCCRGLNGPFYSFLVSFRYKQNYCSQFGYNPRLRTCFKTFCKGNEVPHQRGFSQGFSALQEDSPWESGDVWSILAFYMFILHIPFSFGGLSVVALLTGQPQLDPPTEILSLLTIQILEFTGTLRLLKYTAKPQYKFTEFFKNNTLVENRNWFLASALGFGILVLLVFMTSLAADRLFGPKSINNPLVKEILVSSDVSKVACILVYCIITPLLEEVVYRGFLLTSLSSTMEWQRALVISSLIFSAAHFSAENFPQLFIIGCVFGSSYCWTANLNSPILIHSLYNALTLIITYFY